MCRPQCRSTKQNALEPNSQWAMYGKVCNCVGMGWGCGWGGRRGRRTHTLTPIRNPLPHSYPR